MTRILVAILTSSKPDLVRICFDSIQTQVRPFEFDYDTVVIVNSLCPTHLEDVRMILPPNATIHTTESNGKPGKGHNSVLHYFRSKPEYDYCILVDGDDFLYPRAFMRLQHYLRYAPDMLFIAFHDNLSNTYEENTPHISFHNKCYLTYNVDAVTANEWCKIKGDIHPFQRDINHMNTIARPFVFSRKSLDYDIYYDENMKLYDDFIVALKAFEHQILGVLKVFAMIESNMYLYNMLSQDSASRHYFSPENEPMRIAENERYQSSIKNRFLTLRRWELKRFPVLELGQNSAPDDFFVKCQFVDKVTEKLNVPKMVPQRDNIDIVLRHCKETGNTVLHDDMIRTLKWLCSEK